MCAFFLLDDLKNANKLLQNLIEQDFMNYYRFSAWPALPENILSPYSLKINNAA